MKMIAFLISLVLIGCSSSKPVPHQSIQCTVKQTAASQHWLFTGTIAPLRETQLTLPMPGIVKKTYFQFGDIVHAGDIIAEFHAEELQKRYSQTLMEYLKAKDNLDVMQAKFAGTTRLYQAGLIPKNHFISEQSSVDTARITYLQSHRQLQAVLRFVSDDSKNTITQLHLNNIQQIESALNHPHATLLLKAPCSGILLYAPQQQTESTQQLTPGHVVKSGQTIATIGDLSGARIDIDVPETDINHIQTGQKAIITGVAFNDMHLQGQVTSVNRQASLISGGLPTFGATIKVPKLTPIEQARIKVGMSATITLYSATQNPIRIPIKAIKTHDKKHTVIVQHPDKSRETRQVMIGETDKTDVIILKGLSIGEVIVYDE